MTILIDGRLISDRETGISRYTEELLKIYVDIFDVDNITLIVSEDLKKDINGVEIIKTNLNPFSIIDFLNFHKLLKTIEFDVYHTMFYSNSFFKIKNKIYITTVHDLMYKLVPNFFKKSNVVNTLAVLYFDVIVKRSLKNSDYIISISKATKQDIKKVYKLDSVMITEGINELTTTDNTLEIDTSKVSTNNYFLYVGNGRPHKNIEFLKECYLKSSTVKKLIIVGHKGHNLIQNEKEIIYTGYINDYTLKYLYQNASAFVFPSLYEGFGLPILEAINLDTIVFSSNNGSLKEFGDYNIFYFSPYRENELIDLLNSVDNIEFDYNKKESLLEKYNWDVVKSQLKKFYKENIQ